MCIIKVRDHATGKYKLYHTQTFNLIKPQCKSHVTCHGIKSVSPMVVDLYFMYLLVIAEEDVVLGTQ